MPSEPKVEPKIALDNGVALLVPKRVAIANFGNLMTNLLDGVVNGTIQPDRADAACKVADVMIRALEMRLKYEADGKE